MTGSAHGKKRLYRLSKKKIILLLMVFVLLSMGGFIAVSEQPGFCNSCHVMNNYYASWAVSTHNEVSCLECHMQPGFFGHVQGKINGMAQAIDCMVGRMGTKPNATVTDNSCLRSECHYRDELEALKLEVTEERRFKFTHLGHIGTEVDGISITCGICHSHFEGEEHFKINTQVCFTCHFLKSSSDPNGLVDNQCQLCHDPPVEPVHEGDLEVDHNDLVVYEANCEMSCHKKQLSIDSAIKDSICLMCHDYRDAREISSTEMHQLHCQGHKVECFACHLDLDHTSKFAESMEVLLDCQDCHSETHEAQRFIYAAQEDIGHQGISNILSPMFLTHVECNGCHVQKTATRSGVFDSLGTVATAVPEACDGCHEPGTGDEYIPFWQDQTKKLYDTIRLRIDRLEVKALDESDEEMAQEMLDKVRRAREILDAVEADGSWGVHNLKYTEAMLITAKDLVSNDERGRTR